MPVYVHLPLFSYVGFTMNRTAFGVVTPKMCGTTIEIHHEQYMATSLEHVVRFLDVLQGIQPHVVGETLYVIVKHTKLRWLLHFSCRLFH